jgi:predicted phosphoribosyltransferase
MNEFAAIVALKEGGKEEANIAEIKQILRITMEELGKFEEQQILELVRRYKD